MHSLSTISPNTNSNGIGITNTISLYVHVTLIINYLNGYSLSLKDYNIK